MKRKYNRFADRFMIDFGLAYSEDIHKPILKFKGNTILEEVDITIFGNLKAKKAVKNKSKGQRLKEAKAPEKCSKCKIRPIRVKSVELCNSCYQKSYHKQNMLKK